MFFSTLKKGYSLMEIVIVIAIIGILVGVVGPNIFSYLNKSKYSATEQTLRVTKQAIISYYTDAHMKEEMKIIFHKIIGEVIFIIVC